ncbi:hypothetical protein QBC44DRAFT_254202, partial [Cladorrhinum sp. PSN332]
SFLLGLDQLAAQHNLPLPIIRCAPTGVAANNINGSTIHSTLRLPVTRGPVPLMNNTETTSL